MVASVSTHCKPIAFSLIAKGNRMNPLSCKRLNTHYLQQHLMAETIIDELYLEIEELEKHQKLGSFIFGILSLTAFMLTLMTSMAFAADDPVAETITIMLPFVWFSAFIGFFFLMVNSNAINKRKKKIKFERKWAEKSKKKQN